MFLRVYPHTKNEDMFTFNIISKRYKLLSTYTHFSLSLSNLLFISKFPIQSDISSIIYLFFGEREICIDENVKYYISMHYATLQIFQSTSSK